MRACNEFRERDAEAALASLRSISSDAQHSTLIRHNLVVFNDGLGGMQVGIAEAGWLAGWVPSARACCWAVKGMAGRGNSTAWAERHAAG
jgi:hypothetical protein